MELHQLRYFRAVAQYGSFTLAARREHVSQPTLSHQILKLENELGAELFNRTGKAVKLTELGEVFLPVAESVLRQLTDAQSQIREVAGIQAGRVYLGVIPTVAPFFLPNVLSSFFRQHPLVEVKVVEEVSPVLLQLLRDGNIDIGLMPSPATTKGLLCTEVLHERLFAAVGETHPLATRKQLSLPLLAGTPFLSLKDGHCFRDNVAAMFQRAKIEPRITFESGCFLTILNMVKAGIGISVVPEMAVQMGSGCRFIPIESDRPVRVISLVQLQNGRPTRAQELLVDFVKRSGMIQQEAPAL